MSMKRKGLVGILLLFTLFFVTGCGEDDPRDLANNPSEEERILMGTMARIQVFNANQEDALEDAFARVEELDEMFAMENPDSEISAINEASGIEPVEVSDEVFHVMEVAMEYAEQSNGTFDPTIGVITELWHIGQEDAAVPEEEELDQVLDLVDYTLVEMDEEAQTIYLPVEGMTLDLGAIAKGFITDEAARILVEHGVDTAIVDMGGDIFVLGSSARGPEEPWNVGIQDPFEGRGEIIGMLPITNEAIVTSGIYERVLEEDGNSYHHLLNPETGYPFENEIAGISVIAESALDGDAMSTVIFSLGVEAGLDFANTLEDVEVVFVTEDQEVYASEGYGDVIEITDDEFELAN